MDAVTAVIADAWESYLGRELAEERARDVATVFLLSDDISPEEASRTLTRCFVRAMKPPYNRVISGSSVIDAVNDAIAALAAVGHPGLVR